MTATRQDPGGRCVVFCGPVNILEKLAEVFDVLPAALTARIPTEPDV